MATNIIHLTCQHCGAALEIDSDNLMAYCPHCGQKLLFDVDQIGNILLEKEKTNREKEKTKQKVIDHDLELKRLENEEDKNNNVFAAVTFLILFLLIGLIVIFSCK